MQTSSAQCDMLHVKPVFKSHSTSVFPRQYHSTNAPHLYSSTYCFYRKGKRAKPGNLPRSDSFSEIGDIGQKHITTFWVLNGFCWWYNRQDISVISKTRHLASLPLTRRHDTRDKSNLTTAHTTDIPGSCSRMLTKQPTKVQQPLGLHLNSTKS